MRRSVVSNRVAALSIAILLALVVLTISGVLATTTGATETRSLTSSADTRILENAPNTNYGTAPYLGVAGDQPAGTGNDLSALLKWNLSTIPAGSKINSASVTLNVTNTSTQTYQAYELKRPWVESAATWLLYAAAKSWQIAGAKGPLDSGTTVVGSVSPSTTGKQTFVLSPAMVQSWVDNPASNNGIIIASATNTDRFAFSSRETSTSSLRPQLTLNLSLDTTSPETTIGTKPTNPSNNASPSFSFSSNEANSTFECKLDGGAYASCTSPKSLSGLSDGSHTFSVRATDAAGNTDASPPSTTWTVDATAPDTKIDSNPNALTNSASASFDFSSTEPGSSFQCKLDGGTYESCTSPKSLTGLSDGSHTFSVRATDAASNTNPTPADFTWTVDTTPPDTSITSGPAEGFTDTDGTVSFDLASTEAGSTFQCQMDSGDYSSCSSPENYTGLTSGSHTFSVKATDPAGNTDATPATRNFTVQISTQPYPGLRFTKTVGVAVLASKNMDAQAVQDLYTTYMKPAYHGVDDSVDFVVQTKLNWPDVMDDPSVKPTLTNMRNPNWSGYKWDTPGSDAAEIDRMLQAPCVVNGKCKISINIGTGATGGTNPPNFMLANNLAYEGTGGGTYIRVKWYKQEAREYAEAFTLAALERFDDPNISGVKLNEYYPGATKPSDWTASGGQDAYEDGYYDYIVDVLVGAPTDANGDRVAIYQTNPLDNADAFTSTQIESLMLGIADSNAEMFESARTAKYGALHGQVPLSAPLDAPPFNSNRTTTYDAAWDGSDNPFNFSGTHVITVDQIAWYHGHCGPTPMDSEFITKPGEPTDELIAAMDQFGPNGSDHSVNCSSGTDDWGGVVFGD